MADNTVQLVTIERQAQESAIQTLEELLDRAKSGEVVAVAVAAVKRDGSITTGYSEKAMVGSLLGAIGLLQHRYASNR